MTLCPVGLQHFLILGTLLFCIGMYGALARRNAIAVLLSIELMLNGVNILMVAFARYVSTFNSSQDFAGQIFAIFIMTVAAAEASVGLAIVIAVYRLRRTVAVDRLDLMKG
jgi:NAD(P)H-quinone oxidoreductase subunit 4L